MRARCIELPERGQTRLTLGKEYVVILIWVPHGEPAELAVIDDDERRSQWPVRLFRTTDTSMPSSWRAIVNDEGFALAPEAWLEYGFWDMVGGSNAWGAEKRRGAVDNLRRELDKII